MWRTGGLKIRLLLVLRIQAWVLEDPVDQVPQSSGKDLLRSISAHRDGANRICALAQAAGYEVMTDREICLDPDRVFFDKVPDALIIEHENDYYGMPRTGVVWVEVEQSY